MSEEHTKLEQRPTEEEEIEKEEEEEEEDQEPSTPGSRERVGWLKRLKRTADNIMKPDLGASKKAAEGKIASKTTPRKRQGVVKPTTTVVGNRVSTRTRQKGKGKGTAKATPKSADHTPSTGGDSEEREESSVSITNDDDVSGERPPKVSKILSSKDVSPPECKDVSKDMNTGQLDPLLEASTKSPKRKRTSKATPRKRQGVVVKPTTKVVGNRVSTRTTRQNGKGNGTAKATPKSADHTPSTGGDDEEEIEESSIGNTNDHDESDERPPKVSKKNSSKDSSPAECEDMSKGMNTGQASKKPAKGRRTSKAAPRKRQGVVKPTTKVVGNRNSTRTTRQKGKGKGKAKATPTSANHTPSTGRGDEEEIDESSVTNVDGESSDRTLKLSAILASKTLLPGEWKEVCKDMNTGQITAGSMWKQGEEEEATALVQKYLVKWDGKSYLHVSWEVSTDLVELTSRTNTQLEQFRHKEFKGELAAERGGGEFFDSFLVQLERVLDVDKVEGEETRLLVKWTGSSYSSCTYELVSDLNNAGLKTAEAIEAYHGREDMKSLVSLKATRNVADGAPDLDKEPPVFKNGGSLRDYQREGVRWMIYNWLQGRGSILADEMGLGKTLQTVAFLSILHNVYGKRGPFLVIAPLSTVPHWLREFQTWSDMNAVVFHGDPEDREILEGYEMEFAGDKGRAEKDKTRIEGKRVWKSTVVITTPELCIRKDVRALLQRRIAWDVLVVDEAHRLKNSASRLNVVLKDYMFESSLLLTGTPLQNNTEELWTLLNLVDEPKFRDQQGFVEKYGDLQAAEDVSELQEAIKPYLLRRMKEDVEKAVPPKEEIIIEVELTEIQKQYYRAIYDRNTTFLLQGKKQAKDAPSLMNLAMQLRKCCNHPFLISGVEDDVSQQLGGNKTSKEHLVKHSGKLVLLDKLLPRLKTQGHRVLLFSQFKIMLDILEDYLIASDISYGRIDGDIQGRQRQKEIDSFQAPDSDMLVMLLSTRAGGVGITLTAADTCIIYDSDWNPQNDVQAQARCHRIGQTKSVKVYRLLVAKTYETHMFKTASRKLGLDEAVLSGTRPQQKQKSIAPTAKEVEMLLKHGAYDVFREGDEGEAARKKFCEADIETILSRAVVVDHSKGGAEDGAPSNSFSKASFVATPMDAGDTRVDVDAEDFWTKTIGLTVPEEKKEELGHRAARAGKKKYTADSESGSEEESEDEEYAANSQSEEDESSGDEFAQVPKKAVVLKGTHLSSLNVNTEASKERSKSLAAQAWCAGERLLGPHVPVADDSDDDQSSDGPDAATTETPVNLNQDAFIERDPVAPGADRPLGGKIDAGVDSGVARSSPSRVSVPGMSPPSVGAAAAARRAMDNFDLMEDWDDFFRRPADSAPAPALAPAPSPAPTSGECGVCLGTGTDEQQGVFLVCRRDDCNTAVHESCYPVVSKSVRREHGSFVCNACCEANVVPCEERRCLICRRKGRDAKSYSITPAKSYAMIPTHEGNFVHYLCFKKAVQDAEVPSDFDEAGSYVPPTGVVGALARAKQKRHCHECDRPGGVVGCCEHQGCSERFHPLCGAVQAARVQRKHDKQWKGLGPHLTIRCKKHLREVNEAREKQEKRRQKYNREHDQAWEVNGKEKDGSPAKAFNWASAIGASWGGEGGREEPTRHGLGGELQEYLDARNKKTRTEVSNTLRGKTVGENAH